MTLKDTLYQKLLAVYKNSAYKDRVIDIVNIAFREGSVIVDYSVQFSENDSVPPEQLNSIVSSAVNNNAFGPDLRIDLASISHTKIPYESSTTEQSTALPESTTELPVTRSDFMVPNWGIAVIVCGAVVLVFLLAMICVLCSRRHTKQKYRMPEDPDDIGYIRKSTGSEFAYDNNIPKETMTVDEEIKAPNQVHHLKTSDLQQNAGQELQKNGSTQAQDDDTTNFFGTEEFQVDEMHEPDPISSDEIQLQITDINTAASPPARPGEESEPSEGEKAKTTEFWRATVIDTDSITESTGKAQSEVESLDLDENMFESLKEFPRTNYDEKQDVWQTHL